MFKIDDNDTCLPPYNDQGKDNMNRIDKYTVRPYNVQFDRTVIGKDSIRTKRMIRDDKRKSPYYGEHISSKPYNNTFQDVDTFRNHELLKKHSNSLCLFELCLRNYKPIQRNVVKRKGKEEMKKIKSDRIERNRNEFLKIKEK